MLSIRGGFRLVTLSAAFLAVAAPADAAPRYRVLKLVRAPQPEALRQLVDEGKYAQAMLAAGDQPYLALELFRSEGGQAKTPEERLAACRAYLTFFPRYDCTRSFREMRQWAEVAAQYVLLCEELGPTGGQSAEVLEQNAAALPLYQRLLDCAEKRQWREFARLADRIVQQCPLSLFVPATAVLVKASHLSGLRNWPEAIYADLYERSKRLNAPNENLLWLVLAEAEYRFSPNNEAGLRMARKIYQTAFELADDPYTRSFSLLKQAQSALLMGGADAPPLARELFRQYLAEFPDSGSAHRARFGLVKAYLAENKLEEAERVARELEKDAPPGSSFAEEYLVIAEASVSAGDCHKAIGLFQEVIRRFPDSCWIPAAYVQLGETYEKLGDEPNAIEAYKKGLGYQNLAKHYMSKGQWQQALRWLDEWRSSSGPPDMEVPRALDEAVCLAHLGRYRDAVCLCFQTIDSSWTERAPELMVFLVRLYRDAGQLSDLEKIVKRYEEAKIAEFEKEPYGSTMSPTEVRRRLPTQPLWELARIVELQKGGNIAALIEICRQGRFDADEDYGGRDQWRMRFAADALAEFGGQEVAAIQKAIDVNLGDVSWLAYALGKSRSPQALELLRELAAERLMDWQQWDAAAYGLVLKGEQGRQVLEDVARQEGNPRASQARRWLERSAEVVTPPLCPKPEPGSLPKDLGASSAPAPG